MINRRGLITGLISFVAAPAIVKATSIMPIKSEKIWMPSPGGYVVDIESMEGLYPYQRLCVKWMTQDGKVFTECINTYLT